MSDQLAAGPISEVLQVIVFGASGTVGQAALKVIDRAPHLFEVIGLAVGQDDAWLNTHAAKYPQAELVCAADNPPQHARIRYGNAALLDLAAQHADVVVMAISGAAALHPTHTILQAGRPRVLAMANKEALVIGGDWLTASSTTELIPVDSEHNALYQLLQGTTVDHDQVQELILTSSGGAFRNTPLPEWPHITPEQACAHPNWNMGRKISVDSATMTNKALEVLEAMTLFDVPLTSVRVVIHPEQWMHAMVVMRDGNILTHCAAPDMQIPLTHALHWLTGVRPELPQFQIDWRQPMRWNFEPPDLQRYPVLSMLSQLDSPEMRIAFNAANETAVEAFLQGSIRFDQITPTVKTTIDSIGLEFSRTALLAGANPETQHAEGNDNATKLDSLLRIDDYSRHVAYAAI